MEWFSTLLEENLFEFTQILAIKNFEKKLKENFFKLKNVI